MQDYYRPRAIRKLRQRRLEPRQIEQIARQLQERDRFSRTGFAQNEKRAPAFTGAAVVAFMAVEHTSFGEDGERACRAGDMQLISAGMTFGMLMSLPTTLFVVLKPAVLAPGKSCSNV